KNPDAMITALRKIESRGDIERANSAVMEMCIDNPREDFADLFDTHPPIEKRIDALVRYAGGHDPGPIALPPPEEEIQQEGAEEGEPCPCDPVASASRKRRAAISRQVDTGWPAFAGHDRSEFPDHLGDHRPVLLAEPPRDRPLEQRARKLRAGKLQPDVAGAF